jgi:glycopeptide antibiotics resistance protein
VKKRLPAACLFIVYTAVLVKVMVLKDIPTIRIGQLMLNFGGTNGGHPPNFIPFKTIVPYLLGYKGWLIAGINLIGNIVLLIPVGLLLPLLFRNIKGKTAFTAGFVFSLLIESLQALLNIGVFDIDDVLLNALGVLMGYWAFVITADWLRKRKYKHMVIAGVVLLFVVVGICYGVYPHDQPVSDPAIRSGASSIAADSSAANLQSTDPCNGTGGTGEIVSVGNNMMTIKRNDGVLHSMILTDRTIIRTSSGPASQSDLRIGLRATVVVEKDEIAIAVLVCDVKHATTR